MPRIEGSRAVDLMFHLTTTSRRQFPSFDSSPRSDLGTLSIRTPRHSLGTHPALLRVPGPPGAAYGRQLPLPSHIVPPLSLHEVPGAAGMLPQVWAVGSHELRRQVVVCGAQSLAIKQATQAPLPSHSVPPLSLHGRPGGASTSMHRLTIGLHKLAWQAVVVVFGQSAGMEQPGTHEPWPSQTVPPLSLQGMPAAALVVPHAPALQLLLWHAVAGAGQSLGTLHPLPWSGTAMSEAAPGQATVLSMHDPLHGDCPAGHATSAGVEQPASKIATSVPTPARAIIDSIRGPRRRIALLAFSHSRDRPAKRKHRCSAGWVSVIK